MQECCKDVNNLEGPHCPKPDHPEMTYVQCKVCNRRHWKLDAKELISLARGKPIGSAQKTKSEGG